MYLKPPLGSSSLFQPTWGERKKERREGGREDFNTLVKEGRRAEGRTEGREGGKDGGREGGREG